MILGFAKQFPWGSPTNFVRKIASGSKIHTFRKGSRWRPGMSIQYYQDVRTKRMHKIALDGVCTGVQLLELFRYGAQMFAKIDGVVLSLEETRQLARNDGFPSYQHMFVYFMPLKVANFWSGQIVHWTDFRYKPKGLQLTVDFSSGKPYSR